MDSTIFTLSIGFLAQAFFSARILVQWILSERARKVLSPSLFWVLSLMGSYLLCIYGWLRNDFAIILGQFISYYIYIWNLNIKGVWHNLYAPIRVILLCTPLIAIAFVMKDAASFADEFLFNDEVKPWLLIFGSIGQVLFTMRFIYQWLYSRKKKESQLPEGFWLISLIGSFLILTYGCLRADLVLIVGQMFGVIIYLRNIYLITNGEKRGK